MAELIVIKEKSVPDIFEEYNLKINGMIVDGINAYKSLRKERTDGIRITCNQENSRLLAENLLLDGIENLGAVEFHYGVDWCENVLWIVDIDDKSVSFSSSFNLNDWDKSFTFKQYCEKVKEIGEKIVGCKVEITCAIDYSGLSVTSPLTTTHCLLIDIVSSHSLTVSELHSEAIKALTDERAREDTISIFFNFPEEVRSACEQYLLYFVQFLRDIGVKAAHELRHYGEETFFAVAPLEKDEALKNIRTALEVYLSLPSCPLSGDDKNIAIQRLHANIFHLKGQIAIAQALIQAKDAIIQANSQMIVQQQQQILENVLITSMKTTDNINLKDKETVVDGLLSVTKYQGKGFEVNLPELLRRLKTLFKKEQ